MGLYKFIICCVKLDAKIKLVTVVAHLGEITKWECEKSLYLLGTQMLGHVEITFSALSLHVWKQ